MHNDIDSQKANESNENYPIFGRPVVYSKSIDFCFVVHFRRRPIFYVSAFGAAILTHAQLIEQTHTYSIVNAARSVSMSAITHDSAFHWNCVLFQSIQTFADRIHSQLAYITIAHLFCVCFSAFSFFFFSFCRLFVCMGVVNRLNSSARTGRASATKRVSDSHMICGTNEKLANSFERAKFYCSRQIELTRARIKQCFICLEQPSRRNYLLMKNYKNKRFTPRRPDDRKSERGTLHLIQFDFFSFVWNYSFGRQRRRRKFSLVSAYTFASEYQTPNTKRKYGINCN